MYRFGDEDKRDPVVHPCKGLFQTCCSVKSDEPIIPKIEKKEGCGHRNSEGVGFRITGDRDNESQYGEFPWMVAIIKEEQSLQTTLNVYQCGGSLIHPLVCAFDESGGWLIQFGHLTPSTLTSSTHIHDQALTLLFCSTGSTNSRPLCLPQNDKVAEDSCRRMGYTDT